MCIDGGVADDVFRFLAWGSSLRRHRERTIACATAVNTHGDQDCYGGFQNIESPQRLRKPWLAQVQWWIRSHPPVWPCS